MGIAKNKFKNQLIIRSNVAKPIRILNKTMGYNFEMGNQRVDMEFIVEANYPIKGNNSYRQLPSYKIENTVCSKYIGNEQNANMSTREVQEYIQKKDLVAIGPIHQVIVLKNEKKNKKKNLIELNTYIQVS